MFDEPGVALATASADGPRAAGAAVAVPEAGRAVPVRRQLRVIRVPVDGGEPGGMPELAPRPAADPKPGPCRSGGRDARRNSP